MNTAILVIAIIAAVAALVGAAVSYIYAKRAAEFAQRQLQIEMNAHQLRYYQDVRGWADLVVETMVEAAIFYGSPVVNEYERVELISRQLELQARLSALLDRGRWFLPNIQKEELMDSFSGFKGLRPQAIKQVEIAKELVEKNDRQSVTAAHRVAGEINDARAKFVEEIQQVLASQARKEVVQNILTPAD